MLWVRGSAGEVVRASGTNTTSHLGGRNPAVQYNHLLLVHYNQHSQWIVTHCIPVSWWDLQGILAPTNSDLLWKEIQFLKVSLSGVKIIRTHQLLKFWYHHRLCDTECTKRIVELDVLDLSSKHHRVLVVYQTKDRAGTLEAVGRCGLLRSTTVGCVAKVGFNDFIKLLHIKVLILYSYSQHHRVKLII